jgi:hypothetical protein
LSSFRVRAVSSGDLSSAAERASDFGEVFIGFSERRKKYRLITRCLGGLNNPMSAR